jgi:triacylglycerol lipase
MIDGCECVRALAATLLLLACLAPTDVRAADAASPGAREAVALIHGLYRTERSMQPLALHLAAAGYEVHNLHYASMRGSPEELEVEIEAQLAACCRAAPRLHFVTHSLGGILLRGVMARQEPANLGRVVMLAPPNHGSELVDLLGDSLAFVLGPTGRLLGTRQGSLPSRLPRPDYPLGVIAGTWSVNPIGSLVLPGASDGTVSVSSTWVEGMTDFATVPATHSFILRSGAAADLVVEFLREGRFEVSAP